MLNVKANTVQGYKEMDIPFSVLSKKEDSKSLAILLPGAGYTVQAPLLHYTTSVFFNKSFEVLQVNYQYKDKFYEEFTMDELSEAIKYDVNAILNNVLADKSYDNYYLIAKSLGTMAMSSVLDRDGFENTKAIWMTPLIQRDDVLDAMVRSKNESLCFIGDKDHCYTEERFAKVVENSNITAKLFPNVNHNLEYDECAVESIDILKSIINDIEQF